MDYKNSGCVDEIMLLRNIISLAASIFYLQSMDMSVRHFRALWNFRNVSRLQILDTGEYRARQYRNSDGTREVVVTAIALVLQVERFLYFSLFGGQRHLTQEGVLQHVVVVDLRDTERQKVSALNVHTHTLLCVTNLDADWLVCFLPVEEPLGVEDGTARVFIDRRADLLSFAANDHVRIRRWRDTVELSTLQWTFHDVSELQFTDVP